MPVKPYGYASGYRPDLGDPIENIIEDFGKQVGILNELFNCGTKFDPEWIVFARPYCPKWVEKFFAQIPWQSLAPTYGEAVEKVFALINQSRPNGFTSYCEGQLGPEQLWEVRKSTEIFQALCEQQGKKNIPAVPAQFGARYSHQTVPSANGVMSAKESGIGIFGWASCSSLTPNVLRVMTTSGLTAQVMNSFLTEEMNSNSIHTSCTVTNR